MASRAAKNRKELGPDENVQVIERPSEITFEAIEGEYRGELRENIKFNYDLKVISPEVWNLLNKAISGDTIFKRSVSSGETLDLYPRSIYLLQTDDDGKIVDASFKVLLFSSSTPLKDMMVHPEP
jgi:hypothetical protein